MFREMLRIKNSMEASEIARIMETATNGVLGVAGDNGYPYTVPVSFAYEEGKIYFHCARKGHKLDAIKENQKVSFCVVAQDKIIPDEFNTLYKSVIAFGKAKVLSDEQEIRKALTLLLVKYSPDFMEKGGHYINEEINRLMVVEISIEHITGKAGS